MATHEKTSLIKSLKEKKKIFLTEKELETLGIASAKALRMQRYLGRGLPYHRVSARQIRYFWPDVVAHLKKTRVKPRH